MKIRAADILKAQLSKPDGYYEDVLSRGHIEGDYLILSDTAYEELKVKYDPEHVGLSAMIGNFAKAITTWARRGFPVVTLDQFHGRLNTCRGCAEWTGLTCKRCGCSGLKLWLATEKCPLNKWEC